MTLVDPRNSDRNTEVQCGGAPLFFLMDHFGGLDELIQVVYQGLERFIVLSTVDESAWTVHVGLKGSQCRWWRGSWSARDITHFLGSKSSTQVLESFARNLSDAFVNGEMCVGDWASDEGAKINLTLGPTSKKPVRIPLVELSAEEAASHATNVLGAIALQAQSRRCRLYPLAFSAQTTAIPGPSHTISVANTRSPPKKEKPYAVAPAAPPQTENDTEAAQRKIKSLEAELAHVKAAKMAKSKSPSSEPDPKLSTKPRPPKGASLANPHKKARKYREVEFASDDE